jgi:hypothetical protein
VAWFQIVATDADGFHGSLPNLENASYAVVHLQVFLFFFMNFIAGKL